MEKHKQSNIKALKTARLIMTLTVSLLPAVFYILDFFETDMLNIISIACLFLAITDWFTIGFIIKKIEQT